MRHISSTDKTMYEYRLQDRVGHAALLATVKKYNISPNLIRVIKNLYDKANSADLFNSSIGDWFRTPV